MITVIPNKLIIQLRSISIQCTETIPVVVTSDLNAYSSRGASIKISMTLSAGNQSAGM